MGRIWWAARIIGGVLALAGFVTTVVLTALLIRIPPLAADPAGDPSAWLQRPHPVREVTATSTLTVDMSYVNVRTDYAMTLQAGDPVVARAREGNLAAGDVGYLFAFGQVDGDEPPPSLTWRQGDATCVLRVVVEHQELLRDPERTSVFLETWQQTPAVDRRHLTVRAGGGLRLVGVPSQVPVRMDDRTAEFDGRPGGVVVTVFHDDAAEAARTAPVHRSEPSDELLRLASTGRNLAIGLLLVLPWLALRTRDRRDEVLTHRLHGLRQLTWVVVATVVVAVVLEPLSAGGARSALLTLRAAPLSAAVVILLLTGRALAGDARPRAALRWQTALAAVLLGGVAIWLPATSGMLPGDHGQRRLAGLLILAVVAGGVAVGLLGGPARAALGAATAAMSWSLATVTLVLVRPFPRSGITGLAVTGMALLLFAAPSLNRSLAPMSNPARTALVFLGAGLFVPVFGMVAHDPELIYFATDFQDRLGPTVDAVRLLEFALLAGMITYFGRVGRRHAASVHRWSWSLAFTVLLVLAGDLGPSIWFTVVGLASTALLWPWVAGRRGATEALSLVTVTPAAHTRLFRGEIRRRLAERGAHDYHRLARALLRDRTLSFDEYDHNQRKLDAAATVRGKVVQGVPLSLALSTNAGQTPRDNALAALRCAVPVAAVIIGLDLWNFLAGPDLRWTLSSGIEVAWTSVRLLRWAGYALFFGFFYPLLRGRTPVAKALALALLVLPVELFSVVGAVNLGFADTLPPEGYRTLLLGLGIRLGQVLVFSVTLGLAWERRLAGLAGYGWDRLRNVRSLRTLATPATTVVVAVATALGTALAGSAVAALLTSPGPPAPSPQQPTAVSPSPSPPN